MYEKKKQGCSNHLLTVSSVQSAFIMLPFHLGVNTLPATLYIGE